MDPKRLGLEAAPNEIILQIVEHMDTETRKRFMATNKGISKLIEAHERSISSHRMDNFILAPLKSILSSHDNDRHILQENTFAMVQELELRDRRIDHILREYPDIFCLSMPPWLPYLNPEQQARLLLILKRALYQCDRISDIAVNVPGQPNSQVVSSYLADYDCKPDPFINGSVRLQQVKYIMSLSLEDIAGLFMLLSMVGFGFTHCCIHSFECKTVFEESTLRHGTWFLWAQLRGGPGLQELAPCILSASRKELHDWEAGVSSEPPGLKMTVVRRFRELAHAKAPGVPFDWVPILKKVVIGDDEA
ncbi:hypothetical protein NUW58_g4439 [Xylaria curta]|uniref:Uncharacterized protein n=1 Tax=Xylaria curta TaxID=42375 RepID=A0ACC1P7I3_9PEZI|nr:hypothetical protein NUW58_g4439 [Xylaria curta]